MWEDILGKELIVRDRRFHYVDADCIAILLHAWVWPRGGASVCHPIIHQWFAGGYLCTVLRAMLCSNHKDPPEYTGCYISIYASITSRPISRS